MALVLTTLASAKATNDKTVKLTSATGVVNKMLLLVDSEYMRVTDATLTPTIGVVPGWEGRQAQPHGILAPVVYGLAQEFVNTGGIGANVPAAMSFGVDGAITGALGTGVPVQNTVVFLTKATAGAYTLAGPATDQQNTVLFVSTTAAAHTITYTAGFYANTTSSDVATFPATAGATFTIRAQGGVWMAVTTADDGVTIA